MFAKPNLASKSRLIGRVQRKISTLEMTRRWPQFWPKQIIKSVNWVPKLTRCLWVLMKAVTALIVQQSHHHPRKGKEIKSKRWRTKPRMTKSNLPGQYLKLSKKTLTPQRGLNKAKASGSQTSTSWWCYYQSFFLYCRVACNGFMEMRQ